MKPGNLERRVYCICIIILLLRSPFASAACSAASNIDWCFTQGMAASTGTAEPNDELGAAVAVGDYNGDGNLDLAIGAPGEDGDAGVVHVLFGDGTFPRATNSQYIQIAIIGSNVRVGSALATVDFNNDGFDDLAIGIPSADRIGPVSRCGLDSHCNQAGNVLVLPGSAAGLVTDLPVGTFPLFLSPNDETLPDPGAHFGAALAVQPRGIGTEILVGVPVFGKLTALNQGLAAEFTGSGTSSVQLEATLGAYLPHDLSSLSGEGAHVGTAVALGKFTGTGLFAAIGAPNADPGTSDAGVVAITSSVGISDIFLQQSDFPPAGNGSGDGFGTALAVGDFNGDGRDDLVIGAPFKDSGTNNPADSGRIYVANGSANNLVATSFYSQNSFAGETPEAGDNFGYAFAVGDLNGDLVDDLIVGVPGEEAGAADNETGFVYTMFGVKNQVDALSTVNFDHFRQGDIGGTNAVGDRFGSVLATGDFNRDGVADIVIGVPERAANGQSRAGQVYITRAFSSNGGADLAVTFDGSTATAKPPFSGIDTVKVSNAGPIAGVINTEVVLTYPAGLTFTPPPAGAGWVCTNSNAPTVWRCRFDQLLAKNQDTSTLTINYSVPAGFSPATVQRSAQVVDAIADPALQNNFATLVRAADVIFANGFD